MKGNKALRRAMTTCDAVRIMDNIPLIVDSTELITPEKAQDMLHKNENNRPINWKKVEEYADSMRKGEWKFHSQGIILDPCGNILTGQKRLWAIVYSGVPIHMRVSKGCPKEAVRQIDRGTPQSSRDLAARETKRKHSPTEVSLARGYLNLMGNNKPTADNIADVIITKEKELSTLVKECKGTKKTKAVLMIMSAMLYLAENKLKTITPKLETLSAELDQALLPSIADKCWGRGVAFTLAMEQAKKILKKHV